MDTERLRLAIAVPSGFHARELLAPLKSLLEKDNDIENIFCITPGARASDEVFPKYGDKFSFYDNPLNIDSHRALLGELKPHLVITTTAGLDVHDIPVLRAAQAERIPTLTFVASWDNVYKMERLRRFQQPHILADTLVVWNSMMAEHLLRVFPEVARQQVHIVGAPRFDFFHHHELIPTRQQLFEYLGIPYDDGQLIHIATTELYPMDYIVRTIRRAISRGELPPTLHLYASVHPGGDMRKHEGYARAYNVSVRFSFGRREKSLVPAFAYNPTLAEIYMLVALFKHADLLVNHSSTVAIESFVADVPVINVKYGRPLDWWRWRRSMVYRDFQQHYADITRGGATTIVTGPRHLVAAMKTYLQNPSYQHTERVTAAKQLLTAIDGTASQQMLDLIKEKALNHGQ